MTGETEENIATAAESAPMDAAIEEKPKDEKKKSKDDDSKKKKKKKKKGFFARIWNGLFGSRNDDFERRLERISKEEKAIITRMRNRAQSWGSLKRYIILFSVLLEVRSCF